MNKELAAALYLFLEKQYGGLIAPYEIGFGASDALKGLLKLLQEEIRE